MKVAAVILAAGASSRLGKAKQLLKQQNQYILEKLYNNLKQLTDSTYVVTGCYHQQMVQHFPHLKLIYNESWQNGMGCSVSFAAKQLKDDYSHLLLCTCDQVLIKPHYYHDLINQAQLHTDKIIASQYNRSIGIPVIFPAIYFEHLCCLNKQNQGAKSILKQYKHDVIKLDCQEAKFDIDTKEDLEYLREDTKI